MTEDSMVDMSEKIEEVMDMSSMMEEVNASTLEVDQAMDAVTTDSEEMNNMVGKLYEISNQATEQSSQISEIDSDMSSITNTLINTMNTSTSPIANDDLLIILEDAIKGHKAWTDRLGRIAENAEIEPIQGDGNKCTFGHYYNAIKIDNENIKEEWNSIDSIHQELHRKAHEIERAIESNDTYKIDQIYAEAKELSNQILEIFNSISEKIKAMSEKEETVF